MGKGHFTENLKRHAVAQLTERGLPGCGDLAASLGEPAFALRLEAEVRKSVFGRSGAEAS